MTKPFKELCKELREKADKATHGRRTIDFQPPGASGANVPRQSIYVAEYDKDLVEICAQPFTTKTTWLQVMNDAKFIQATNPATITRLLDAVDELSAALKSLTIPAGVTCTQDEMLRDKIASAALRKVFGDEIPELPAHGTAASLEREKRGLK